jgi:hypothetical protein
LRPRFLPFVCLLLGACSSVSVIEEQENAALAPKAAPTALLVRPFEVSRGARFDVAPASEKDDPRDKVGRLIAEGALTRGARWVAPTKVFECGAKPPKTGLLVEGRVLVAQQGSRALRLGVGFGAGRTRLDTMVQVYNLAASDKKPWLNFKTTGGSNMEPGLLFSLLIPSPATIPVLLGVAGGTASTVTRSHKGVTQDAKRTGRAVVAAIHDRLVARQLVPRKAWPKRIGTLGTPVGQLNVPSLDQ